MRTWTAMTRWCSAGEPGAHVVRAIACLAGLLVVFVPGVGAGVDVGRFSRGDLGGWEEKSFKGRSEYRIEEEAGRKVLVARSEGTASGLVKKIEVDLSKTPYLTWHWKAENLIEGFDEKTKAGDDYPARVYVIASGGLAFWKTRAIDYVWSSSEPPEASWPNAFTERAVMVAVQSGPQNLGRWVVQKRNVREDFRRYFGEDVGTIHAVALMTDSDQTGVAVSARYGDISFEER